MSVVGEMPFGNKRFARRSAINPLDKSTIVSIFPRAINEQKVTIQPNKFNISPGSYEKPSVLVIGPSSWWRVVDEDQEPLEIIVNSISVADAVVRDYSLGMLESDNVTQKPGLFYIPGEWTSDKVLKEKKLLLDHANECQRRWYMALIKHGDSLWARTNGNPLAIDDTMRFAARELSLDKPWVKDYQSIALINCTACGQLRNPQYPVCASCNRIVDSELAKKMGISA